MPSAAFTAGNSIRYPAQGAAGSRARSLLNPVIKLHHPIREYANAESTKILRHEIQLTFTQWLRQRCHRAAQGRPPGSGRLVRAVSESQVRGAQEDAGGEDLQCLEGAYGDR